MEKIKLPPLEKTIIPRPGYRSVVSDTHHYVPSRDSKELWDAIFEISSSKFKLQWPVLGAGPETIDEYFGHYGFRYHPFDHTPDNFHMGTDIAGKKNSDVLALADGILEYSGYDVNNGLYIMMSHPDIQSEDGFILYTLYMHLKDVSVRFTAYEKMLREISLHTYPEIKITKGQHVGVMGNTGKEDIHSHLHLQSEFRHKNKNIVVAVDPLRLFGLQSKFNKTAGIKTVEEFELLKSEHLDEIRKKGIDRYWNKV